MIFVNGWAHSGSCPSLQTDASRVFGPEELKCSTDELARRLDAPEVLCGWSLGGMLCLELAIKRPELVKALVLLGSTPCFTKYGQPKAAIRALKRNLKANRESALEGFMSLVSAKTTLDSALCTEDLLLGLDYLETKDMSDECALVSCPVLCLHGTADKLISVEASYVFKDRIPDCTLEIIQGAGHALPFESSEEIIEPLNEFFSHKEILT